MKDKVFLSDVADLIMGQSPESASCNNLGLGLPFLQGCGEFGDKYPIVEHYCVSPKKISPKNSILISVRAPVGDINLADQDFVIGRGLAGIAAKDIDRTFLYYSILQFKKQLWRVSQGSTFEAINSQNLHDFEIKRFTPKKELKIANILSTCDEVIEKTEAAIAKYQALKQGMMHDLFNRGIDLNTGKLRPSYQDAPELYKESDLGMIPKDWEVKELINLCRINGRVGWKGYTVADLRDQGPLAIGAAQIDKNNMLKLTKPVRLCYEKYYESPEIMVQTGDLLIVQRGTIGKYVIIDREIGEATINPSMILLNNLKIDPHFLYYSFGHESFTNQIINSTSQTGVPMISQAQVGDFKINVPKDENELIKMSNRLKSIDKKINNEQSALAKYQQLKAGLMQDLLTGKVEVSAEEEILKN